MSGWGDDMVGILTFRAVYADIEFVDGCVESDYVQ